MRILNLFFVLIFISTGICCKYSLQNNCADYKIGHFFFHAESNGIDYLITRNDSLQIETEKASGKITEWKITWINDCEYNLLFLNDNYGLLKSGQLKNIPSFNYKIISSTSDYFIFETRFTATQPLVTDTIFRVKSD